MVDIRPNVLPDAILPLRSGDELIVDQGVDGVRKVDPFSLTDSVSPVATQEEATVGTNNTKRMTPLRTKQSIASEVGVSLASNSQGAKADTAVQSVNGKTGNAVTLVKGDVGLGNVDNTTDLAKPISTATQTALEGKASLSQGNKADTAVQSVNGKSGNSISISKSDIGLSNVDNTSDANKPISTATQTALDLKANDSSVVKSVNGVFPTGGNVNVSAQEVRLKNSVIQASSSSYSSDINFINIAGYYDPSSGGEGSYSRITSPNLGEDIITNGGFSTDTDWIKGTGWSISGGSANKSITASQGEIGQTRSLISGVLYAVTYTISGYSGSGFVRSYFGYNGTTVLGEQRTANGTYTDYLRAAPLNARVVFQAQATVSCSIDNVSVKPIFGAFRSSDGDWWGIHSDYPISIKSFGAKVDALTNDAPVINGALNLNLPIFLDSGSTAISSKVTVDNTLFSGDVDPSTTANRGRVIRGLGARRSALLSTVASGVAVDIIYDVGTKAHTQESFGEFSITGFNTSDGIKIKNAAFLEWENTYIAGFNIGLTLESVLSSKFSDMRISWCQYGISAIKGTGFSQPNAITFQQLVLSNNSVMAYSGGTAHANVNFIGGSIEGNGTQGVSGSGGIFLNFDGGSEGSVGGSCTGVYFEGNGGDADIVLNNTGNDYITYNIIGCNFNRVGTTKFVTTNIQATGKITVNLIGCAFKGYNGYVEDALRPYITKDANVRLNIIGCDIPNTVAAAGLNSYGGKGRYRGAVASTGTARQLPKGWTSARDSAGVYTVTHNLNTSSLYDYSVVPVSNTSGVKVERVVKGGNIFQIVTVNNSGTQTDSDFEFILDHG